MSQFKKCALVALCLCFFQPVLLCAMSTLEAVEIIKTTSPLYCPGIEMGRRDKSDKAKQLYQQQMDALAALKGTDDVTLIPFLIPFLHYNSKYTYYDASLYGERKPRIPDFQELCEMWPAFGLIVGIPNASETLADCIKNKENLLEYRMAAFHVLRYIDKEKFNALFDTMEEGLLRPPLRLVRAIENGSCFLGIPIIPRDDIERGYEEPFDKDSMRYLSLSKPMEDPQISMGRLDISEQKRRDAKALFGYQMQKLEQLRGCKDKELVKISIPYLHYSREGTPSYISGLKVPKFNLADARRKWPAFDIILNIPGAEIPLSEYILDTHNPTDRRLAVLIVLRYINSEKFQEVATAFDHEFSNPGSHFKAYLKGIEDGTTPFMGVYPIRVSD